MEGEVGEKLKRKGTSLLLFPQPLPLFPSPTPLPFAMHATEMWYFSLFTRPHPASGAFLLLAPFWRTQERPWIMNWVRSFLSMHRMFLGYSFGTRPNSRVFATADSVMTIGLSINRCSHSKKKIVWRSDPPPPPSRKIGDFFWGEEGVCTQASALATLANSPFYSYGWKRGWSWPCFDTTLLALLCKSCSSYANYYFSSIMIKKRTRFVSKQGQPHPHICTKAWIRSPQL